MSPVWVKLGDFGVSKQVLAQATTTFHTQVSTPVYSAPEILGLDSNSESSNYTNAVDIWSLGCVIYELLAGAKLFVSDFQLCRYFSGTWPFPDEKLRGLSPPTDHTGISLLKTMLAIQPGDRPTATSALENRWLTGLKIDNKRSRDDKDERTTCRDRSTLSRKRKSRLSTSNKPKKTPGRGPTIDEGTKHIPGGADSEAKTESEMCGDLTIEECPFDISTIALPDTSPTEGLVVPAGFRSSELVPHNFQETHSKSPKRVRKSQTHNIPQTYRQGRTLNTILTPPPECIINEN